MASGISKIMGHYVKMVPIIAELRAAKSSYIFNLMDRVHDVCQQKVWWNNTQGYADFGTGLASGVLAFAGYEGAAKTLPFFSNTAKTFLNGRIMPLQLDENLLTQNILPGQNESQRNFGDVLREVHDNALRALQAAHEAKSKAVSNR